MRAHYLIHLSVRKQKGEIFREAAGCHPELVEVAPAEHIAAGKAQRVQPRFETHMCSPDVKPRSCSHRILILPFTLRKLSSPILSCRAFGVVIKPETQTAEQKGLNNQIEQLVHAHQSAQPASDGFGVNGLIRV